VKKNLITAEAAEYESETYKCEGHGIGGYALRTIHEQTSLHWLQILHDSTFSVQA
jgi:hypothetical protein